MSGVFHHHSAGILRSGLELVCIKWERQKCTHACNVWEKKGEIACGVYILLTCVCVCVCVCKDSCDRTLIALSCIIHETERRACYLMLREQGWAVLSPRCPAHPTASECCRHSPDLDTAVILQQLPQHVYSEMDITDFVTSYHDILYEY